MFFNKEEWFIIKITANRALMRKIIPSNFESSKRACWCKLVIILWAPLFLCFTLCFVVSMSLSETMLLFGTKGAFSSLFPLSFFFLIWMIRGKDCQTGNINNVFSSVLSFRLVHSDVPTCSFASAVKIVYIFWCLLILKLSFYRPPALYILDILYGILI